MDALSVQLLPMLGGSNRKSTTKVDVARQTLDASMKQARSQLINDPSGLPERGASALAKFEIQPDKGEIGEQWAQALSEED